MKLERVALHGFLSHADTDWAPNGARLVALTGPNGAGKSTLASDALRYALYDAARGRTDDVVRLGQTDASVLVEFGHNGNRYRVTRTRTTRSGGKTSLELAIAAGDAWTPLTGDSIGETEAQIVELLRLDADTFASAVLLSQGDLNRFADAKASERKRVLGQVLGLDVYERAEARARELARDVDARLQGERAQLARLEDAAAGIEELQAERDATASQLVETEANIGWARGEREALETRIRELDVALAAADALAGQIAALEADRAAAGEAWRRAAGRMTLATQAIADAERMLAGADEVAAAAADLPVARAEVDGLATVEAEDRRLAAEHRAARDAIAALERPHHEALTTWRVRHDAAAAKVAELEAHGKAGASVCEACGQPIGQDIALEQLAAARAALDALGPEPQAPIAIMRAHAQLLRIETRQRELDWDPAAMIAAQSDLARLASIAARQEGISAAAATRERAITDRTDAELEKSRTADQGAAIAARIEGLRSEQARAEPIRAERSAATGDRERVIVTLDQLDAARRQLERAITTADALLDQRRAAAADALRIREVLDAGETELARLRRLVVAFGVGGIPARIVEGVLPELAGYANELLGELRPGMTLELRAQRAKKDGKGVVEALDLIVRDPAGERPLGMFSGGERTSVSLALAVGLSRLVARRAGARIESLVVDEPDGLDSEARRAFGIALRTIAHRGELERVVLVSHHPDLAEFADEVYEVTKGDQGSEVALVT